jgi:thiol-disulfide isomerase/thioredoxin
MSGARVGRRSGRLLRAGVGLAAALYGMAGCTSKTGGVQSLARGQMAKLEIEAPSPEPTTSFSDATGKTVDLATFKGKVVVLNLWATWCAPCVQEMPTLARLAQETAGQPVAVVPVSLDRVEDRANAIAFIAKRPPLPFYSEPSYQIAFGLRPPAEGLPTTVIIDPAGQVRARLAGGADWSGPDALRVVRALESPH